MLKSNISGDNGHVNEIMNIKIEPDSSKVDLKLEPLAHDSENINKWHDGYLTQQVFIKQEIAIEYENFDETQTDILAKTNSPVIKSELKSDCYENGNYGTSSTPIHRKKKNQTGKHKNSIKQKKQRLGDELLVEEHKMKKEHNNPHLLTPLIKTSKLIDFQSYFACNSCDFYCNHLNVLDIHKKIHHLPSPLVYEYERPGPLKVNPKTMLIPRGKGIFYCDICTYRFKSKHNLLRHNLIHSGEKPFVCKVCDFKFNRKSNLKEHMLIHGGTKPFSCEYCDYKCFKKSSLTNHNFIHNGEKPYSCDICGHQSKSKGHFDRHILTHSTIKPFACHMCKSKFKIKSNLKQHVLIHSGVKSISCNKCDYKCYTKSNLKCHESIRHNDKVFPCNLCDSKFKRNIDLKNHTLTHTEVPEPPFTHATLRPEDKIIPVEILPRNHAVPIDGQPDNYKLPDNAQMENKFVKPDLIPIDVGLKRNCTTVNLQTEEDLFQTDNDVDPPPINAFVPVNVQKENSLHSVDLRLKNDIISTDVQLENLLVPIDLRLTNNFPSINVQSKENMILVIQPENRVVPTDLWLDSTSISVDTHPSKNLLPVNPQYNLLDPANQKLKKKKNPTDIQPANIFGFDNPQPNDNLVPNVGQPECNINVEKQSALCLIDSVKNSVL